MLDAGLTWVHHPEGLGGLGGSRGLQGGVDAILRGAGAPDPLTFNAIGFGMAAPTVLEHGTPALARELPPPLGRGEHVWCQLSSEPGAGSDLAGLATSAVPDGDGWLVDGQKVWSSLAHKPATRCSSRAPIPSSPSTGG